MLTDEKILITGPAGQIGEPLTRYLAGHNEVWGIARFGDADARARIDALRPAVIARLEEVWLTARQHAAGRGLTAYGVIVVQSLDGGWLVATDAGAIETAFTAARCAG